MKQNRIFLAVAVLACSLPSVILASSNVAGKPSIDDDRQMTALSGFVSPRALAQNSASCAPDRASAVWSADNALAGYRCETPAQGGN